MYTGLTAKIGVGLQVREVYEAAKENGLRVVEGGCPTVGVVGWLPAGGHGPLTSAYGLGADRALSGGGSGNYAVLFSMTIRAHPDGPVAGARFLFSITNSAKYWVAITAWLKYLLVLDTDFPSLKTAVTLTNRYFYLDFATFPNKTSTEMLTALEPFVQELGKLDSTVFVNQTVGNRFIPRSLVRDKLPDFIATLRGIMDPNDAAVFVFVAFNVTHARVGNTPQSNSVNPAWRDTLLLLNFGMELTPNATWDTMSSRKVEVNEWVNKAGI
ncbi:hypothetical protein F5B19DRAFT_500009 [Rostrohypoxylon terebratum]|nr:hypothetical protein F5B19DRAFT_500009 [Rostrohypoxylon terebratum]